MDNDKITELLLELSDKVSDVRSDFSARVSQVQKELESIKTEMLANYKRSDENNIAVRQLLEEKIKYACSMQETIKTELQGQIELSNKGIELNTAQLKLYEEKHKEIDIRISTLEDAKKNHVYTKWQQIGDKIFWIIIAIIFAAIFKYFNFTPPKI